MAIVGKVPEAGARLDLARKRLSGGPPWRYEGTLTLAGTEAPQVFALVVTFDAERLVNITSPAGDAELSKEWLERVRLLVRSAWKPNAELPAPPLRIQRWRAATP
jgi:hypothetical protein